VEKVSSAARKMVARIRLKAVLESLNGKRGEKMLNLDVDFSPAMNNHLECLFSMRFQLQADHRG
jgi:hypothetical protein